MSGDPPTGLEFRVLGPLEVRRDGEPVILGGAKQRALLAILLLRANQVVPAETLIDELWGERPPATAAAALQVHVANLRKALEPRRRPGRPWRTLVTEGRGYRLHVEADQLDLLAFERLLADAGRALTADVPELAATALQEALALWHGAALADLADEPFASLEIGRLEELRVRARTERIEAELALGRHAELVGELESLVAREPLQERLRGQHMLALYRSGRQADALAAYQEARRALVEELGIEPGPALRRMEAEILRHDPALDLAERSRAPTRPDRAVLLLAPPSGGLEALLALAEPLARSRPARELILAALVGREDGASAAALTRASAMVQEHRTGLVGRGVAARAAAFTSTQPGEDAVRLAAGEAVELMLLDAGPDDLAGGGDDLVPTVLDRAPCDVGVLVTRSGGSATGVEGVILVPFGGAEDDWAAVEVAAWLASVHGARLALLGVEADPLAEARDASRLLANASLLVQRVLGVAAEPRLASPGPAGVLAAAETAALLVVGLSPRWRAEGMGHVRLTLAREARPPVLLVRGGSRPGGLAPAETFTRYRWSAGG
jgi:DNA-binding SARP family transcriptional activator